MVMGYSINDKIVVFDRIREELKLKPTMTLREIINYSINKTMSRTILTSFSTFLAAAALFLFGTGIIVDFSLVFMLGIVAGTFSSIFIASQGPSAPGNRLKSGRRRLPPPRFESLPSAYSGALPADMPVWVCPQSGAPCDGSAAFILVGNFLKGRASGKFLCNNQNILRFNRVFGRLFNYNTLFCKRAQGRGMHARFRLSTVFRSCVKITLALRFPEGAQACG